MPSLVYKETSAMSSKFDSSMLENIRKGNERTEDNVYFNTEEALSGEYCHLVHKKRNSTTQNSHMEDSEQTKRPQNVTLQNAVRYNGNEVPETSTNRARTRLTSDRQLSTHKPRYLEEQNHARMIDINPRNAPRDSGSVRTQPSITAEGGRRNPELRPSRHLYRGISEDLPGNSRNTVITDQPKPRGMVVRREEQDKRFPGENIPRHLRPKPRKDESKRELENRQDFTQNRMQEGPRARSMHADRLDFNMNRTRAEGRQAGGRTEYGREGITIPIIHNQSSTEEHSAKYNGQREEFKIENRGVKIPNSSTASSRPHRYLEITDGDTKDSSRRENRTRRNEDIEMTNMTTAACNPRVHQLRKEETLAKNPLLGLAFPRPHSFDVPENKPTVSRTFSSPELRGSSLEEFLADKNDSTEGSKDVRYKNNGEHKNRSNYQPSNNSSKAVVKIKGKRSKSLPVAGNTRTSSSMGRRGQPAEASPLRYFAYLGKRFQFRERLLSAHNVLSARPVILTSTSVISPEVTTNFCRQLEGSDPGNASRERQGACQDLIDCCTCMCCVKALFYHCTKDNESEGHYAEHPCTCSGPDGSCVCRWSVLGLLSLVMPCILCYLPVQGCRLGVEYCRRKPSTPDCNE